MKIRKLKLLNFRNYDHLNLEFSDGLNVIYGDNGSGKSNLVEAIYLLALTKSFRITNDKNLIKKGESTTVVEGKLVKEDDYEKHKVTIASDGKKVEIDENKINRISDYVTKMQVVVFTPSDVSLINASPADRRRILNIEISQIFKEYLILLSNYNKILKQRNAYLKQLYLYGNASREYLDILTNKLIQYGLRIYEYRLDFIEKINALITKKYQEIFEYGELTIKYNSDYKNKSSEEIFKNYQKMYDREVVMGKTLSGVHHDDIIFILDGKEIGKWGSNGQQKNAIFAFKLAELEVIKEEKGNYPILILDDLFSALDNKKIKNIVKLLNNDIQTFITTTELSRINKKLLVNAKKFNVKNDAIREV